MPPPKQEEFPLQVAVRVAMRGMRPRLPEGMGAVGNLLQRCWHADPAERPTVATIIRELEGEVAAMSR